MHNWRLGGESPTFLHSEPNHSGGLKTYETMYYITISLLRM